MTMPATGLRVLQVLGSSAGGVSRHVAQVATAAGGRGVHAVVAGPKALRAAMALDEVVPFCPVEIRDRPGPEDLRAVRALRRLARRVDVVHAHGLRAGALSVLATRGMRGRPAVVVTLHNLPVGGASIRAVAGLLELVVARGAQTVLGVSGDLVDRARARGARATVRALVPAPPRAGAQVPAEQVRAELGVRPGQELLVTVGRLAPQKGLDLLCAAAGLLRDRGLLWVVAGDGPLQPELAARITAQGLPVRLLGRRSDVADLLAAADVVVSTARWEGQPLGVQEALAVGAAVVATDVGGTREVTADAAVLVAPDAVAVAAAVRSLLEDRQRRQALGVRARERAAGLPDLAATMDQLVEVWSAAARRRTGTDDRRADGAED